jgi:hypothetical protein
MALLAATRERAVLAAAFKRFSLSLAVARKVGNGYK